MVRKLLLQQYGSMVSPTIVVQGVWLVAGRFCGFCRAWIAGVASAILELTIAPGCCCGRGGKRNEVCGCRGRPWVCGLLSFGW